MSSIAIIPARGGSKRVPRKNIRNFLGKPIIAYSIEAALQSNLFDEVMVSTDDEEIAENAQNYGAKVPFYRTSKCADDFASTVDVLLEVLGGYEMKNLRFDNLCCIYPTAPFVTALRLQESFALMIEKKYDSILPVVSFSYPVLRGLKIMNSKAEMVWPQYLHSRSQDFEPVYHDAGQFYFARVDMVKEKNSLWTDNTGAIILSEMEVQDIDNEMDWSLAEIKYKFNFNN